jgi:hypothetical protein
VAGVGPRSPSPGGRISPSRRPPAAATPAAAAAAVVLALAATAFGLALAGLDVRRGMRGCRFHGRVFGDIVLEDRRPLAVLGLAHGRRQHLGAHAQAVDAVGRRDERVVRRERDTCTAKRDSMLASAARLWLSR